jgi:hypothetical protein
MQLGLEQLSRNMERRARNEQARQRAIQAAKANPSPAVLALRQAAAAHKVSMQTAAQRAANAKVLADFPEGVSIAEEFRQDQEASRFIAHRAQQAKLEAVAKANQEHNNKHVGATAPSMTGGEGGNPYHDEAGKFTSKGQAKTATYTPTTKELYARTTSTYAAYNKLEKSSAPGDPARNAAWKAHQRARAEFEAATKKK